MERKRGQISFYNSIIATPSVSLRNIAENDVRLVFSLYKPKHNILNFLYSWITATYVATGKAPDRCNCLYISSSRELSLHLFSLYRCPAASQT